MLRVQAQVTKDAVRQPEGGRNVNAVPPWDQAYARYRPLLFSALSKLAMHGYAASPIDSLDLIHDFFIESWQMLASNYDPTKASFETYLYGAFVRFARPRIIKMSRWRDSLVHPDELTKLETHEVQVAQTLDHDLLAIRGALSKLSSFEREILISYVSDPHLSEKELARRFSVTRYRLRLCLADALGKIAIQLGDTGAIGQAERSVILALWQDGRTAKETGRLLQKSTSEIQAMKIRLFRMLSDAVKGTRATASRKSS